MTNADRIRSMTDEKLADWINDCCTCIGCPAQDICMEGHTGEIDYINVNCKSVIRKWLMQEYKDDWQ